MINYSDTAKLVLNNGVMNLKSAVTPRVSVPEFKSVLQSASGSMDRPGQRSISKSENKHSFNEYDAGVRNKSFRDVNAVSRRNSPTGKAEPAGMENISSRNKSEKPDSGNDKKSYDETVNVLAQMLGIQPNELVKLAQDLGFSPEELQDTKALGIFADKLSNMLGMDEAAAKMLKFVTVEISRQLGSGENIALTGEQISAEKVGAIQKSIGAADGVSTVYDRIKAKIDGLIHATKENSESVQAEVLKAIAAMRFGAAAPEISKPWGEQLAGDAMGLKLSELAQKEKDAKEETADPSAKGETAQNTKQEAVPGLNFTQNGSMNSNLDHQNNPAINIAVENQVNGVDKQANTDAVFAVKQPVTAREVMNQVVESAKIIVGENKSEMVIHLKPDHLGKLELKVVTEQGIVAAKFVAENQQVKEVLESNLQLLKDSLQKQGIAVHSVSVQVGQDNRREYQPNTGTDKDSGSPSGGKYRDHHNDAGMIHGVNLPDNLPESMAQYLYEPNTINLTA